MRIHKILILTFGVVGAALAACNSDDTTSSTSSSGGSSSGDGGGSSSGDTGASSSGDTGASSSGDTGASSSGDTGVADTGGSSGDSGDGATALSCDSYCAKIGSAATAGTCTAGNAQYATNDQCKHVCTFLTQGASGDTGGDTVGCRDYHAGNTPADTHCPHAGPYGGDGIKGEVCVPAGVTGQQAQACAVFCEIMQGNCVGANQQFASATACTTACALWSNDATTPYGQQGPTSSAVGAGKEFNCRTYHLLAASTGAATDATTHCPHAGAATSAVCK